MNTIVPLEFLVPTGWVQVAADTVGAPEGSAVLLDAATRGSGFTTNITVGGEEEPAGRRLVDVADDVLRDLEAAATDVVTDGRDVLEDPDGKEGLVQQVRLTAEIDGARYRLVQSQVFRSLPGAVLRIVLTATEDRFPVLIKDFEGFVGTVRQRR
ncbi:MAG TPA: hypothetical protein VGL64_14460 [Amycolatopsis sp.]|jgi:hypothetical protein